MKIPKLEIEFIQSIIAENNDIGYEHFLRWQKGTDFKGDLTYSVNLYLPFIYNRYKTELKTNPQKQLLEGIYKKNLLINSLSLNVATQLSEFLIQNQIKHAFTGSIGITEALQWNHNTRKISNIECLIEPFNVDTSIGFLKEMKYELSPKKYSKQMYQLTFNKLNSPSIQFYFWPVKFHNNNIKNDLFLNETELSTIHYLSAKGIFIQNLLNFPFLDQWHLLVDCLLLQKKYDLNLAMVEPYSKMTGTLARYSELLNETDVEAFKPLRPIQEIIKDKKTFGNYLLKNKVDYYAKSFEGKLAFHANKAGLLNKSIYNPLNWLKILSVYFNLL